MENRDSPESNLEAMIQELVQAQLALGKSVSSTSQFLHFVLLLANENLGVIRSQLETIRNLATEIDKMDRAS